MNKSEKVLRVEDLKVSFKTINGNVQAVRNISFDLHKGETLSIVGESGSGKSVTSRSILGILANNAIVQNGRIIYDGQDLLKLKEDEFHKLRGDKISMIFQDPMSSLNPIMKVGKQITEAMILKNKSNRKESKRLFNAYLKSLKKLIFSTKGIDSNSDDGEIISKKIKDFDQYQVKHVELELAFNNAFESATQAIELIKELSFEIKKNAAGNLKAKCDKIIILSKKSVNYFVVNDNELLERYISTIKENYKNKEQLSVVETALNDLEKVLSEKMDNIRPNFFSLAYYMISNDESIPNMDVSDLNKMTRQKLDDEYMFDFISMIEETLAYNFSTVVEKSKSAIESLEKLLSDISEDLPFEEVDSLVKKSYSTVLSTINALDIYKYNPAYTFKTSCNDYLYKLINGVKKNELEEKRFNKQTAINERKISKGKVIDWSIPPMNIWDLDDIKNGLLTTVKELIEYLKAFIETQKNTDFNKSTIQIIDYLNDHAISIGNKITKSIAKSKAIKIMEEVGIPEATRRYKQYPFQFSGGMRQRVVIAIALSANPNVLICDEPTTALDVTIQSQILELINKLKVERNLSIIFITHDLGVVANMADRIAVMYAGKIVEIGTANDIFYNPKHPYTWALLSSMPDLETSEKLESIAGTPPNMIYPPVGDAFAARNKYAMNIDFEMQPPLFKVSDDHYAATWLLHENAPVVNPPKIIVDRINRMKLKGDFADE